MQRSVMRAALLLVVLTHLQLDLTVDYDKERVGGRALLTVRNDGDTPVAAVPVLLNRLMTVERASAEVTQDVVCFEDDSKLQVNAVTLALREPLAPGKSTTIVIDYGGHLVGYTETGSMYIKDHVAEEFTILREDAYAFPAIGVPSRRRNRAQPRSDFTFDVRIDVPKKLVVATGGTLAEAIETGERKSYRFTSDVPVPFLNIAVAGYQTLDADGVRIYSFSDGAKTVMERTQKALALFEQWLGPLPRKPAFTIVEIPDGYGPQASLTAGIILESKVFKDPDYLYSLYHEVGHFWNVPDKDVPSPRWNEGLSTWFQKTIPEVMDGKANETFDPWIVGRVQRALAIDERLRRVPLKDYGRDEMTDYAYSVGYLYLRRLEREIGREALLAVLRDYFQKYKTAGGTLRDFTAMLETRHPAAKAIDRDWIETTAWAESLRVAGER